MQKIGEIFMTLLVESLKIRVATRALAIIKEKYPKLELQRNVIFYDKVEVLVSKDKVIRVANIQEDYEIIYQNQLILELDNIIKKITE
jgi:hypothetical protein